MTEHSDSDREPSTGGSPLSAGERYHLNEGTLRRLWQVLGAQVQAGGTRFALWAPNASAAAVVGDFNHWDAAANPMHPLGDSGLWETFVPGVGAPLLSLTPGWCPSVSACLASPVHV